MNFQTTWMPKVILANFCHKKAGPNRKTWFPEMAKIRKEIA